MQNHLRHLSIIWLCPISTLSHNAAAAVARNCQPPVWNSHTFSNRYRHRHPSTPFCLDDRPFRSETETRISPARIPAMHAPYVMHTDACTAIQKGSPTRGRHNKQPIKRQKWWKKKTNHAKGSFFSFNSPISVSSHSHISVRRSFGNRLTQFSRGLQKCKAHSSTIVRMETERGRFCVLFDVPYFHSHSGFHYYYYYFLLTANYSGCSTFEDDRKAEHRFSLDFFIRIVFAGVCVYLIGADRWWLACKHSIVIHEISWKQRFDAEWYLFMVEGFRKNRPICVALLCSGIRTNQNHSRKSESTQREGFSISYAKHVPAAAPLPRYTVNHK